MSKRGKAGSPVALVSTDGKYVYLEGTRYNRNWLQNAPRNFVEKVEIRTGVKSTVFESATDLVETVGAPLDDDFSRAIVTREGPKTVPDSYLRDMKTGQLTKLTNNKDMTPEVTNAIRKKIQVTRVDGIKFFVDLALPADYKAGTKLPAMFWFYPYEYTEQAGYDRSVRTQNINRFPEEFIFKLNLEIVGQIPVSYFMKEHNQKFSALSRRQFIGTTAAAMAGRRAWWRAASAAAERAAGRISMAPAGAPFLPGM